MEGVRIGPGFGLLTVMMLSMLPVVVTAQGKSTGPDEQQVDAFDYEERSTVKTIPFRSMEEDSLANTVIEGGLQAPAAGVPVKSAEAASENFYLDPLALQPRDSRTDLGRSEIPVDIQFRNPRSVPGQTFSGNYVIRPPANRHYDTLNTNVQGR